MAFVENPEAFLEDFGVPIVAGSLRGLGILDMPGEVVQDGYVITTDYTVRCLAKKFGGLIYGQAVTVAGKSYTLRENRLIDDGTFCLLSLQKT